ncbi:uncharacterized protein METZ01_LOCUS473609 [marine metagenome]|uniref:Uncharacterized protein n=1 Tax=marine metagenome TaxID=408172 RepID=A0A383BN30_9ZZZZ
MIYSLVYYSNNRNERDNKELSFLPRSILILTRQLRGYAIQIIIEIKNLIKLHEPTSFLFTVGMTLCFKTINWNKR